MSNEIETLVKAITNATRNAFVDLFKNNERFYYCVLMTTEEALPPFISAWSWEALERKAGNRTDEFEVLKWSYADSPYYNYGTEYFKEVRELFAKRPNIYDLDDELYDKEFDLRLSAMELAIKQLDKEGIFELNQHRSEVYVNVEIMPPCISNTERALRLNKEENITNWLIEAAEE
jgi:hypothetical protein